METIRVIAIYYDEDYEYIVENGNTFFDSLQFIRHLNDEPFKVDLREFCPFNRLENFTREEKTNIIGSAKNEGPKLFLKFEQKEAFEILWRNSITPYAFRQEEEV